MRKRRRALRPDGLAKLLDFHTDYYYNVVIMPGLAPSRLANAPFA